MTVAPPDGVDVDSGVHDRVRRASFVCAALALVAIAARWPAIARGELLLDSDNALGPLMSQAIWRGGYWPFMLDGQNYLGALDAYLLAPLVGIAGVDPRFWLVGQTALLAFVVLPLAYALGHRVGGAWGGVAAGVAVATGAAEMLLYTASAPLGYLSNLAFGLALLLVGTADGWSAPRRAVALGVLGGAGWWNNPQVAVFLAPVLLGCAAKGELATSRSDGRFAEARRTWVGRFALGMLIVGTLAAAATLALTRSSIRGVSLGPVVISLERPEKYLPRTVVCAALGLALLELITSRHRRRTIATSMWFAGGFAVGVAPYVAHKVWGPAARIEPWMQFTLEGLGRHAGDARDHLMTATVGGGTAGTIAGWVVVALAIALAVGRGVEGLRFLGLRSRGLSAPIVAVLPAVVLVAIMVLRGSFLGGPRHFMSALVPGAALIAWGAGALARRSIPAAAALVVVVAVHGIVGIRALPDELAARERPFRAHMLRWLAGQQLSHGYGQYWVAFELSLLGGDRLLVASEYDPMGNYDRFPAWFAAVARAPGQRVRIYDLEYSWDHQRLSESHQRPLGPLHERRCFGSRYIVMRYCRD